MIQAATQERPKITGIDARDIINLTARLAQIMAEEVDLLSTMKVKKIAALQEEKLFLINALETHKKLLKRHPELSEQIPSRDKADIAEMVGVFEDVLAENHRKLQMAREVNQQVVNAIRSVVAEQTTTQYYSQNGMRELNPHHTVSVTLNQTV